MMKILHKEILVDTLNTRVIKIKVSAGHIAKTARPGQFIVLMVEELGERVPLTIVESSASTGEVTLIFQEAGLTTRLLGRLSPGSSLFAIAGPLGHATEIKNYGRVILMGGGVGIAEIYPVAKALAQAGNQVTTILGARTKELLILENELKKESRDFFVTTDDGSYGRKGFVTDVLQETLSGENTYNLIYAVGPIPMMQRVAQVSKAFAVKTIVSLNAIMIDATGMCGCCRVSVGGETKFSCVDGPEFDAHQVDWDELVKRNKIYSDKEKHICNLIIK